MITILYRMFFCNKAWLRIILNSVKMLLIQPPVEDFYNTSIRTYPLALLYLAQAVQNVCDAKVLDLRTGRKPKPLKDSPFPDLETFYRKNVHTPFSFFSTYFRFGANNEEIKRAIENAKPDVVCISSLFTTYSKEAVDTARLAKEVDRNIVTIVGGIHPTLFPRHVLASQWVDYVVRGEGETPLAMLVDALKAGRTGNLSDIEGVCCKYRGEMLVCGPHTERNIDAIPARRLIDADKYRIGRRRYSFFLTSRGCPFHCAFCGRPTLPFRKRSIESIEQEIADCMDLKIEAIDFEDDMLTLDADFFGETMGLFRGKNLTLSAMNGIYTENLTTGMLDEMFDAGFRRLNFSLVDMSRALMKEQKRLFPANFLKLIPYLEDSPFLVETHFIIGLPGQTPDEITDTILFLMGTRCLPGPSLFYLAPNSPLFDEIVRDPGDETFKIMRSSALFPVNPLLTRETLYTCMKLVRFVNYVKHVLDREQNLTRLSELPALVSERKGPEEEGIVSALVFKKRFIHYDIGEQRFRDEPVNRCLVDRFFARAKGMPIKGFKTARTLIVD